MWWPTSAPLFLSGIHRLFDGQAKGFRIAMTCACKDPAICHRALQLAYQRQCKACAYRIPSD
jgi:hypothetical protein